MSDSEQERREAEFRKALAHCEHLGYDREETVRYLAAELVCESYDEGHEDGFAEGYAAGLDFYDA